jgi:acyl-CoA reductase-like NAD-dependent aldehyde dehydrogenase
MRIEGRRAPAARAIEVTNPFNGEVVGTVPKASVEDVQRAFGFAKAYRCKLSRFERANILKKAAFKNGWRWPPT